jgi:hypothetical protein
VVFEVGLLGLAFVFRLIAQRRWERLDWMRCRADLTVRAAA